MGYSYLVFAFEYEDIGYSSEWQPQLYDLGFCRFVGYVPYVDNPRRFANILFQFHLKTKQKHL